MWDNIYQPDQPGSEGGMMHTAFCDSTQHQEIYNNMKKDLQEFIDKDTSGDEEIEFYDWFTSKY